MSDLIFGPRVVLEALRAGARQIQKIYFAQEAHGELLPDIRRLAGERQVPVVVVPKIQMDQLSRRRPHQGVAAEVAPFAYATLEAILSRPGPLLVLDGVTDPQNLGAILRSAAAFGVAGVILPEDKSAPVTAAAVRASAGAAEHVPTARVDNLVRAIEAAKASGRRIVGSAPDGTDVRQADLRPPVCLVIGSEAEGIRRMVRKACDAVIRIPQSGRIGSLNASVAAGILLYEVTRKPVA